MSYIAHRVGDRRVFAVEFEFDSRHRLSADFWGCLWLWAGGKCVGQSQEIEMVEFGLSALQEAADDPGRGPNSILSSLPAEDALNLVMWARYGEDDPTLEKAAGSRQTMEPYEILPRRTGSFFDHWQAILLERDGLETIIFRQIGQQVNVVGWPAGTFRDTVNETRKMFYQRTAKEAE